MIITGSNANMLSSEMATVLTGKYLPIEMLPFSLAEFFEWHHLDLKAILPEQRNEATVLEDDYLRLGGYPETVAARTLSTSYLSTLFDSIIWKDVVKRHKIRKTEDINNMALYLLTNFCNPLSANDIADALNIGSVATTQKFMAFLHEPFLFYYLPRYNNKLKLMKRAPQKVYIVADVVDYTACKYFRISCSHTYDPTGYCPICEKSIAESADNYLTSTGVVRSLAADGYIILKLEPNESYFKICVDFSNPSATNVNFVVDYASEIINAPVNIVPRKFSKELEPSLNAWKERAAKMNAKKESK